jgi:hypothetical protein
MAKPISSFAPPLPMRPGARRSMHGIRPSTCRTRQKSFGVTKAWRFWSLTDPSLHQATYEFADEASLDRAMKGEDLKRLVADFNRDWPDVTRTREMFVLAEEFAA